MSVTRLEKVYRQGERSEIVLTAHAILEGATRPPNLVHRLEDVDPARDITFVAIEDAETCAGQVVRLVTRALAYWFPDTDPVMDAQVLAPMHKGACGVGNLNALLQTAFDGGGPALSLGGTRFAVGDKIIQTKNNYEKVLFNGDLGRITAVDADARRLEANFDGEAHSFEKGELSDLAPAFAITIHKSQGSEFPFVIVPLLKQHFVMLQRNLLYPAITRGRRKVFLLGDPAAYAMAIRNTEATVRRTGLQALLVGGDRTGGFGAERGV